jgi:DNA polymerase IV
MSHSSLGAKTVYFQQQDLLELSDDEEWPPNESLMVIENALADSSTMPPRNNTRPPSSFNGPTPKEIQARAEFEAHATERRANARDLSRQLTPSSAVTEVERVMTFSPTKPQSKPLNNLQCDRTKLKRSSSLPDVGIQSQVLFYKQMGVVPRDLKHSKNAKPADSIVLEPEGKQLLRHNIVYFYPNDDVSMVRRTRIHKIIQLGAAWVKVWRDDITHVLVDDTNYTYGQLLRHLNRSGLPVSFHVNSTTQANAE